MLFSLRNLSTFESRLPTSLDDSHWFTIFGFSFAGTSRQPTVMEASLSLQRSDTQLSLHRDWAENFYEKKQRSQLHLRYLQAIAAWTQRVRYRVGGMTNFRDCCKWQQILGAIITTRLAWAAAKLQLRAQALHVFTGMVCLFLAIEKKIAKCRCKLL